jgi:hypothetical protein
MAQTNQPATIKIATVALKKTEVVTSDSVPESDRLVMIDDQGIETHDPKQAKETIPVVEIRVVTLNGKGELVAPDQAHTMRILLYGAGERLLRSTTMVKP